MGHEKHEYPAWPLVWIRWIDHFDRASWHDVDAEHIRPPTPMTVDTVGWLTHETEEYWFVSNSINSQEQAAYSMAVLKVATVEFWTLVEPR